MISIFLSFNYNLNFIKFLIKIKKYNLIYFRFFLITLFFVDWSGGVWEGFFLAVIGDLNFSIFGFLYFYDFLNLFW
jgi:hypothetical protein